MEGEVKAMAELLEVREPTISVFVSNDSMVTGWLNELRHRRFSVPGETLGGRARRHPDGRLRRRLGRPPTEAITRASTAPPGRRK